MAVLNRWTIFAAVAATFALCLWWQGRTIAAQAERIAVQDRHIGEVTAANAGLEAALAAREATRLRAETLLAEHAGKAESASARARTLERRLTEALSHAKTLDLDQPLPADAAFALCLRYRAARGLAPADSEGDASAAAAARAGDSAAALCGGWRQLTPRQALDWLGLLLDHAGAERLDKAALREWAASLPKL